MTITLESRFPTSSSRGIPARHQQRLHPSRRCGRVNGPRALTLTTGWPVIDRQHQQDQHTSRVSAVTCHFLSYSLAILGVMKMRSSRLLSSDVPLEQPAEQRQPVEPWRPVLRRLLAADVDAADDRRLAVADQHLGDGALGVDGRDAVDGG